MWQPPSAVVMETGGRNASPIRGTDPSQCSSGRERECSDKRLACCRKNTSDLLWGATTQGCSLVRTAAVVLDSLMFLLCVFGEKGVGRERSK